MHYMNGREAKEGDPIITKQYNNIVAGKLHSLNANATTCNGQLCYPIVGGTGNWCVTVGECVHAEDAWNAMQPQETAKAPETPPSPAA